MSVRLGVRLSVQVALVNTLRQRTHGCTHAQALRRLDVTRTCAALACREPRRAQFCILECDQGAVDVKVGRLAPLGASTEGITVSPAHRGPALLCHQRSVLPV
jgi:hypothetical protein